MSLRRDRAVSLATVLLALAGGVALGGGPLQGTEGGSGARDAEDQAAVTQDDVGRAQGETEAEEQARAVDDAFARATARELLGGRLDGRAVTVVTLPGADPDRVAELVELVATAGGTVTVQAEVQPALLDVADRQLVAELTRQTQDAARQPVEVPERVTGYDLTARLLGHALVVDRDGGASEDRTGEGVLASFATADLLTTSEPVTRRGSVAVLVAGAPASTADDGEGAGTIVAALAAGLDARGDGVALVGPTAAGASDGLVGALRASGARRDVSTVDALDSIAGAVVAVRALAAEAHGRTGHYGSAAAPDGVLPR